MDSLKENIIPSDEFTLDDSGKFGITIAIWKKRNNSKVAIKVYTKGWCLSEIGLLKRLDHPNVIKFFGIVLFPICKGVVIEYASKGNLFEYLASKSTASASTRLTKRHFTMWSLDIALAIQYLHNERIVHRDIKSPNILISDDVVYEEGEELLHRLKICDFGISKEINGTQTITTQHGGASWSWAPPEIIQDSRLVNKSCDIYSLGIIFWELWTCENPWSNIINNDIAFRIKHGIKLKFSTYFPDELRALMGKCLQFHRENRCRIDDVVQDIEQLMLQWHIKDFRKIQIEDSKQDTSVKSPKESCSKVRFPRRLIGEKEFMLVPDDMDDDDDEDDDDDDDVDDNHIINASVEPSCPGGNQRYDTNELKQANFSSCAYTPGKNTDKDEDSTSKRGSNYVDKKPSMLQVKENPSILIHGIGRKHAGHTKISSVNLDKEKSSLENISMLFKHIEESNQDLQLMDSEIIEKQLKSTLNKGEIKHLMINTMEVKNMLVKLHGWFKSCGKKIAEVCELIKYILDNDFLQPIFNFRVYSNIQTNMLKLVRQRCIHFTLDRKTDPRLLQNNVYLSFTNLHEKLLKLGNWLNIFTKIVKNLTHAMEEECNQGPSAINTMKECCLRLDQLNTTCDNHREHLINHEMQNHITVLSDKLQFSEDLGHSEVQTQKDLLSEESWIKKRSVIYTFEEVKFNKKTVFQPTKHTMIAFVSTILIFQEEGEKMKVLDCIHKKNAKLENTCSLDEMPLTTYEHKLGGAVMVLSKLNPKTQMSVKEYEFAFGHSNDMPDWLDIVKFSDVDKRLQDKEYITPLLGAIREPHEDKCSGKSIYADTRVYENPDLAEVLKSVADLNKEKSQSLSGLVQHYIENETLSNVIGKGEFQHLYFNVEEVTEVVTSTGTEMAAVGHDGFQLFAILRRSLENDRFQPIIKYNNNICFQRNILQFQKKYSSVFNVTLDHLKKKSTGTPRVSEYDLVERLSSPSGWLAILLLKFEKIHGLLKEDFEQLGSLHRTNETTLKMLKQVIRHEHDQKERLEHDSKNHFTSMLLSIQMPTCEKSDFIWKLLMIEDDWLKIYGKLALFSKKSSEGVFKKKKYVATEINIYATTSAIIITFSTSDKKEVICKCCDRNYVDMENIDDASRENWMPRDVLLFRLFCYEKVESEFKQTEYVIGLESNQTEDLGNWKTAIVVKTGDNGTFDDYRKPVHIVSKTFEAQRPQDLSLEVNDFVEIIETDTESEWVKGKCLRNQRIGTFPKHVLGDETESEFSKGQAVKKHFSAERKLTKCLKNDAPRKTKDKAQGPSKNLESPQNPMKTYSKRRSKADSQLYEQMQLQ